MRTAQLARKTAETDIALRLDINGTGQGTADTGVGFLNHMLTLFTRHGGFDLDVKCVGDTFVDDHHSTEDIGIVLGDAFREALGDRHGICRYGQSLLPMDETLVLCAVDVSGRGGYYDELPIPTEKVGAFDTELVREFFIAFCRQSGITLHLRLICGTNAHHIIEGAFKAAARALRQAVSSDARFPDSIPSTKGII